MTTRSTRLLALWLGLILAPIARADSPSFSITYDSAVSKTPINARVYVMFAAPAGLREPRTGPDWFNTQPFFAVDAKDWKAGEPLVVDAKTLGYPSSLNKIQAGEYRVQAVIRLNPDTHSFGGEGNAYSPVATIKIDPAKPEVTKLVVDKVAPPAKFVESDRVKLVDIPSPLLSAFHKRPIRHKAAVLLPEGDLSKKRATLYIIPGFGGDHLRAEAMMRSPRMSYAKDLIRVVLSPDCGTGHHVFADSATNGPRGQALVEELIPYIEKTYPAIAEPKARLLNGHSSGGWSSLWLQVNYPDFFGGTWSTSPDPVDFRDFQRIDLYAKNANMFKDEAGNTRPVARMGTREALFYEPFSKMEDVIGDGGQLHSFEAVFSPLGPDGKPRKLWDRKTGEVDPEVAKAWEKYDIRLFLEKGWPVLGPKLKGKLHIYIGDLDTFYLEGAVKLLQGSLEKLGSDASILIVPGKDHGSVLDRALTERLDQEIKAAATAP